MSFSSAYQVFFHKEELKTRPVCKAQVNQSPNGPLADLVCEVLSPFVEEADKENRTDLASTEELCAQIKKVNDKIEAEGLNKGPFQQEGKLIVGSKDVKSFYPEMDVQVAAEEVKKEIEESTLEIEVDTLELALSLACSMTQEEIDSEGLKEVVHTTHKEVQNRSKAGSNLQGHNCWTSLSTD